MRKIAIIILLFCLAGCSPRSITPVDVSPTLTPGGLPTAPENTSTPMVSTMRPLETVSSPAITINQGSLYISYVKMVDRENGWALVSGEGLQRMYILRTADGGSTWEDVTPPQVGIVRPHGFYFSGSLAVLDANTAWAIADGGSPEDDQSLYGTVWQTQDGGLSWRAGNPISIYRAGPLMILNGFSTFLNFTNAQDGWLRVTVQGVMGHSFNIWFRTTDGGLTWERFLANDNCSDYVSCSYLFLGESVGLRTLPSMDGYWSTPGEIQVSEAWQIEKTMDGGATWSRVLLTPPADLVASLFTGTNYQPSQMADFKIKLTQRIKQFDSGGIGVRVDLYVYAVEDIAHPLFNKGLYFISDSGGQTWQPVLFSEDLFMLTASAGWRFLSADGNFQLQKTDDGGKNWDSVGAKISAAGNIQFADKLTGWMILHDPDLSMQLMRTIDGGQSWTNITANVWGTLLSTQPAEFSSGPSILPHPEPWIARMPAGSPLVLNTIHMSDSNNGWSTSLNGAIFHTSDGGGTWLDVTPQYGTLARQRDFFALDASHAWTVILPLPGCIEKFAGPCPDYYLTSGPVWFTQDGGQTWNPGGLFPDPDRSFETQPVKVRFANRLLGWSAWYSLSPNGSGTIYHLYKTVDGGVSWVPVITEPHRAEFIFLNEESGFKFETSPDWARTLDDFMAGVGLGNLQKTLDGGQTWEPVNLPNIVFNIEDVGLKKGEATSIFADCFEPEMRSIGAQGIVLNVNCSVSDVAVFRETYYSPDGGLTWRNWISSEYALAFYAQPRWEQWIASAAEFFLENGIGWRLYKPGPDSPAWIQHTLDVGKSWATIKTVAWQKAKFDFINERDGWAIVSIGGEVALLRTTDGGQTWNEIQPVVADP